MLVLLDIIACAIDTPAYDRTTDLGLLRNDLMFSQFKLPSLPTWGQFGVGIKLPKAHIHDVEERPEKRARTLKHLLKANHINHSIIYNELRFHNHTPHILGSAYIFGADYDELTHIYEVEGKHLEPWHDSPGEIALHDWRDFLGKREYVESKMAV